MMKESWLIFCDYKGGWASRWLKKGYTHIYILTKDKFNWFIIDPDSRFLNFKILPISARDDAVKKFRKKYKIMRIEHGSDTSSDFLNFVRPFTCVEVVKYIIGLKVFCFTPYQLWKKLQKMEGKDLKKHGIHTVKQLEGE